MGLLRRIRQYFFDRFLKKKLQNKKTLTPRKLVNLESAKTIGLLFDATDVDHREAVLRYAKTLKKKGKKVELLGFFNNNQEGESFTFAYFNKRKIDWALRPSGKEVEAFIKEPYDLLITVDVVSKQFAEYIAALSNAHLRVGPYTPNTYCYDLMIDAGPNATLKLYTQQIESLLQRTNTKNEAA
jgi:3-deoxy-D-arabino-heptulosonate 7-phosphate (DAHP) synthase